MCQQIEHPRCAEQQIFKSLPACFAPHRSHPRAYNLTENHCALCTYYRLKHCGLCQQEKRLQSRTRIRGQHWASHLLHSKAWRYQIYQMFVAMSLKWLHTSETKLSSRFLRSPTHHWFRNEKASLKWFTGKKSGSSAFALQYTKLHTSGPAAGNIWQQPSTVMCRWFRWPAKATAGGKSRHTACTFFPLAMQ